MFRSIIGISIVTALAACGFGQGNTHGRALLDSFNKAIYDAKSLSVTFSSQTITGARGDYAIDLVKPNKARVETPHVILIADGTNITTFSKDRQTYCKQAQTDSGLKQMFQSDQLSLWKPFFDSNGIQGALAAMATGTKMRKNMVFNVLELQMNMDATKTLTLYMDPQDNLPRQAEFESAVLGSGETLVVDTKKFAVGAEIKPSTFEFAAPDGAREQSPDEFFADRWYTDIDSAKLVAARTNKLVLVFFFNRSIKASNLLEQKMVASDDFKALSKNFVFVRLDIPRSKTTLTAMKVTQTPTFLFIDKDGKELGRTGGPKTMIEDVISAANDAVAAAAAG